MNPPLNILWICMDQHPLANREVVTGSLPLQARMAREGTRFTQAFTVLPICSPARASMLTGLYPHAHGLTENDGRFGGRTGLEPGDWMVHRPFAEAGYRTAWFGKWHLDNRSDAGAFGFEGFSLPGYGYPYGTEAYRAYLDRKGLAPPIATVELPGESGAATGTRWPLADLDDWPDYEAGTLTLDAPAEAHEAFFVADLAAEWIAAAGDAPFFLRVDPWGPHPPYMVAAQFKDSFADTNDFRPANFWSDLAHRPDHHRSYRGEWASLGLDDVGWQLLSRRSMEQTALVETALCTVLEALDRAGLRQRTLVVVSADHGDAVASNGGVANKGGLLVEETVRIPLAVQGPSIAKGRMVDAVATNLDIAPTLLSMASLGGAPDLHGHDLSPLLRGISAVWREGAMIQHYGLHTPILQRAWRTDRWKLVLQENGFQELYDLGSDPAELTNLAGDERHAQRLAEMTASLLAEMERLGDTGPRQDRLAKNTLGFNDR